MLGTKEKMGGPFSPAAKQALLDAIARARLEDAPEVRADHLLLGLLDTQESVTTGLFTEFGLIQNRAQVVAAFRAADRRGGLSDADTDALAALGIELETVVERVEENLGVNALSAARAPRRRRWATLNNGTTLSRELMATIHRAILEAKETRTKLVADGHLLLALLQSPGIVSEVLADHELTYPAARKYFTVHAS